MTHDYPQSQPKIWESVTLRRIVEDMVTDDPRFVGMSRYIVNVRFFWSTSIKTACAGHGFIFFNPEFYDTLPEETVKTVIVHEIRHLILRHLERGKNCDPFIHNEAADHVINLSLEQDGFTFEGTNPCKDIQFVRMSTEQVYNKIYEARKKNPNKGIMDGMISAEAIEDMIRDIVESESSTLDKQEDKAEKDVKEVIKAGDTTGSKWITLDKSANVVIIKDATYHKVFQDYLTDPLSGGKRTFMRPNRRQHGMKVQNSLRLPGRYPKRGHENRLAHLVYALDVSGSITQTQGQQFHDSARTIKKLLNPEKMTVLFFDTHIVKEYTYTDREDYGEVHVQAGGGTDLKDVYRRTAELGSDALVIFTDLAVTIPPKPPCEVIWIVPHQVHVQHVTYGKVYLIPNQ